ncbi:MAG: mechanosensitive ion channel family protein [Deltaproteobacteria bacterium]|nr:mechanosensitive ion channel family protein [Deltaproteobacteria bacterium]
MDKLFTGISAPSRIAVIIVVAVVAHFIVLIIRRIGGMLMTASQRSSFSKARTIVGLITSITVFMLYFSALGMVLREFGVSLTAYLASASIIGLAIGFGSQGLVQDVVTGLTMVFSDLFDVGDMVEISAQSGIVKTIGMRFTVLVNSFGAEVFIPNRTIGNVVNYPRGYVRCLADITLSGDEDLAKKMEEAIAELVISTNEQYPGILLTEPSIEGRMETSSGKVFLRVKFRIWPGRGAPIETNFKQELLARLRSIDQSYVDWMIAINYEVEKIEVPFRNAGVRKYVS